MKKTILLFLLVILIVGCAVQVDEISNETKIVEKEIKQVEEKIVQAKKPMQKTETHIIAEEPEETEVNVILNVGETKTVYIGDRKYTVKLLSVSNRARFVINGEHTKELMLEGVDTLKEQSKVQLLRFIYNGAELKIKAPPEKEQIDMGIGLQGTGPQKLATAIFQKVEKTTTGHAEIIRTAEGRIVIQFQSFVTEPGAGLYIYLVDQNIADGYEVAKLTTITGSQTYNLPEDVDLNKYKKIVIYSKSAEIIYGEAKIS